MITPRTSTKYDTGRSRFCRGGSRTTLMDYTDYQLKKDYTDYQLDIR